MKTITYQKRIVEHADLERAGQLALSFSPSEPDKKSRKTDMQPGAGAWKDTLCSHGNGNAHRPSETCNPDTANYRASLPRRPVCGRPSQA